MTKEDLFPVQLSMQNISAPSESDGGTADFLAAFGTAIELVDFSSTNAQKWRNVKELVAGAVGLGIEEVVIGYAGGKKHIHNRLRQRSGDASLRLLLVPDDETRTAAQNSLERAEVGDLLVDGCAVALVSLTDGCCIENIYCLQTPAPDCVVEFARLTGSDIPASAAPQTAVPNEVDALAQRLFVPADWLRDVLWLLEDKRSVVFYGPPGTGKTYLAQQLAEYIQPDTDKCSLVQLHPSYGYEEFFEGFRPVENNEEKQLLLAKQDGPLKLLVSRLKAPHDIGVLVLDEMNRGNLPRVFGELYFLLEYRDRGVRLMYSPKTTFRLPEGLRIIGTMNTADRSVALLDQALRRRFHFVGLFPNERPVRGMLRAYLQQHYSGTMNWVADVLDSANAKLERNVAIGPSHFMRPDLDDGIVRRIWQHSVLPTIEEHYFGEETRLSEFSLDVLRTQPVDNAHDPSA